MIQKTECALLDHAGGILEKTVTGQSITRKYNTRFEGRVFARAVNLDLCRAPGRGVY